MISTSQPADRIPATGHAETMRLTATENARLLAQLRGLTDEQWRAATDCSRWTVRDVVVHLIASAQAQANPVEFVRQVVAGRPLTAQIGGQHWVDGLNEAQLRGPYRLDLAAAGRPVAATLHGGPEGAAADAWTGPRPAPAADPSRARRAHRLAADRLPVRHGLHP
jgi:hypothetical protein